MTRRLEITLDDETWARLDAARKFEPRASFVKRALEAALETYSPSGVKPGPVVGARPEPVSSRAPVEKKPDQDVGDGPKGRLGRGEPNGAAMPDRISFSASASSQPAFGCPVARCDFRAKSPAAKCGLHGRTVVAVT